MFHIIRCKFPDGAKNFKINKLSRVFLIVNGTKKRSPNAERLIPLRVRGGSQPTKLPTSQ